jgi:ribose transport system substrate-binding protein
MRPHERQQRILQYLLETGVVSVPQLVERLQVSEATVRNDLRQLESEGKLVRRHGGAVAGKLPRVHLTRGTGRLAAPRAAQDGLAWIAQRAARLVNEGETILLLGGAMAQALAEELVKLRAITVLTNSLHLATTLQRNPAHRMMLLGGQLRADADTLDGPIAASTLSALRVQKAFLTCDGLTAEHGPADDDVAMAQLKVAVVQAAQTVVILAPAECLGRTALMSFTGLDQVQHLITTEGAPAHVLNELRTAVQVTVCSERLMQITADAQAAQRWRIGFANLTEQQEFAVAVRQGLEQAAHDQKNIELMVADNAADPAIALASARELLDKHVDLLVEYQQDEHINYVVMDLCRSARVPVVAIDIPMPGATYFGVDNYRAGTLAGDAAVRWIKKRWRGRLDKVVCLEQPESGQIPAARIQGQIDRLRGAFPLADADLIRCETRGDLEGSQQAAVRALRSVPPDRLVLMIGINFNSALGSLAAAESLDRQAVTAVVSQNASGRIRQELLRRNPMLIGAVDYFPQQYGFRVIPLAVSILEGQAVPPAVYTDHVLLTSENVQQIYPAEMPVVSMLG